MPSPLAYGSGPAVQVLDDRAVAAITSPPPSDALDWIESELHSVVVGVIGLPGGSSSAVHRLELLDGRIVILRRYVLDEWMAREPYIPHQETHVLGLLGSTGLDVETPALILADADGKVTGTPMVVMSEVSGRPDLAPPDPGPWADQLAECLAQIHQVDPVPELRTWRRWDDAETAIPAWTDDPDLWTEAKDLVPDELPVETSRLLHRDFHPANVHWNDNRIVGVVDWLEACVGEPAADLAHCRWNLAVLAGQETAVQFTWKYRELTGYEADTTPYDLSTLLSLGPPDATLRAWHGLGRRDLALDSVTAGLDRWLAHLLRD